MRHINESDTRTNARVKRYPDFDLLQVSNVAMFRTGRFEPVDRQFWDFEQTSRPVSSHPRKEDKAEEREERVVKDPERSREESRRRAKSKVRDIALCNRFAMMTTLTLDGRKIDRYDAKAVYQALKSWLSNAGRRQGLRYVIVPEYHKLKSGELSPAIHLHGLISPGDLSLVRATYKDGKPRYDNHGRPVYNITDWPWGWSTAVPLDGDYSRATSYVTKYIGKQDDKIFGKWYLSSRAVIKGPEIIPLDEPVRYEDYRDVAKLASGQQYEQTVFRDVKILTEEIRH